MARTPLVRNQRCLPSKAGGCDDVRIGDAVMRRGVVLTMLLLTAAEWWPSASQTQAPPPWQAFVAAAGADRRQSEAALDDIAGRWRDG